MSLTLEQLKERQKGIGGSDSPVIMGVSPFKNIDKLYLEKRGLVYEETETPVMKRGSALEPLVADMYREETGREISVEKKLLRHPQLDFLIGNIDRKIMDLEKGEGVLEIKCPGLQVFGKCKREGLPDYYQIQKQHYLAVTGLEWGAFAVFNAEQWELIHFDVERDDELIDLIIEKDAKFWEMVKAGTPPPEEEPAIDLPAIGGDLVQVTSPEWEEAITDFVEARAIRQEWEELEKVAKGKLTGMMEAEGAGVIEGFNFRGYYKYQAGRTTFDKKKLISEHPEIVLSQYEKKGKPFKAFRPYILKGGSHE